ncbi:hypothetical protein C8D82_14229 [Victivallis vadensis]|uniref:Uncharacterized protein n=1 Tax=Victivallis vadensis TaxID=172901 RepID=A0A2U1AFL1_9BACT|nr:hypothetical protein C8D82_14229 [Victivallis vadensis]
MLTEDYITEVYCFIDEETYSECDLWRCRACLRSDRPCPLFCSDGNSEKTEENVE